MKLFLNLLFGMLFITSCSTQSDSTEHKLKKQSSEVPSIHLSRKNIVDLSSQEGQKLFKSIDHTKYLELKKYWEKQRPSFCGVCSTVVVSNALNGNKKLTQDNFFTDELQEKIIKKSLVERKGLTLREITESIKLLNPQFEVEKYYSHFSGQDLLYKQLSDYKNNTGILIANFSRASFLGSGMNSGHFSIVAGYDEKAKMVLILEVSSKRESFWVSAKDLYTAMLAVDPVSRLPRGWVEVIK